MKFSTMKGQAMVVAICTLILFSCRKEIAPDVRESVSSNQSSSASLSHPIHPKWNTYMSKIKLRNAQFLKTDEYYKNFFSNPDGSVEPSECKATALNAIVEGYFEKFEFWDYILFPDYVWINQLSAIIDRSKQYFGARGEYTHLVGKYQRKLQAFWNLQNQIRINGQHSETLGNRDKIAEVFIQFTGASREDGYYIADQVISMNKESKVFPQSPLLSFDGFATTTQLIVLGDGLIKALTATGVDDEVVVGGLVSHEWAHQVQFENSKKWYGFTADERPVTPAFNRQMELEADFFSSYFLTHKRGATSNWKKLAEFNELFYNVGDCDFTSASHHGTPTQRQNAARLGFVTASLAKVSGHILTANQLHAIFMKALPALVR